ncbi:MAG: glycosyltransferase family 4 protein [Armatimonadetes bacterium]|nr:glycosyltransferase family 4 protein [Armatimonadota bacterium]
MRKFEMKIAINTLALLDTMAGAERYTQNIIQSIAEIDQKNEYYLILSEINQKIYESDQFNFKKIVLKFPAQKRIERIFCEQVRIPLILSFKKIDLLFSPCNIAPYFLPCQSVVMIFDLHWFHFPDFFPKIKLYYLKKMLANSAKRARYVLTLSQSSKKDIINFLGIQEEKIKVTYCAQFSVNNKFKNNSTYLNFPYILFVGQFHKRKNLPNLIRAYKYLKNKYQIPHKLVLVGRDGDGSKELKHVLKEVNLASDIILKGYVDDQTLADFYKRACVFVYPSLYEGFGIPILEAMQAKVPVVASSASSIPEVVGDAGILVNPYNIEDLAESIYKVIKDLNLKEYLIEKGTQQIKKFSWKNTAKITKEVFEKVKC